MDILQYVGSIGGIAGVLALLMFVMYRYLVSQMRDDRKFMEDRLSGIIESYNEVTSENTKALTELITWLQIRNGKK